MQTGLHVTFVKSLFFNRSHHMTELFRSLRRARLRWQLRSLESQARDIVEARNHAMLRLMQIQREREMKALQFLACGKRDMVTTTA